MDVKGLLRQNSPSILLALGVGGFISAIVYTANVSPKAQDILEEMPPEASKIDRVKSVAPMYAPVAGLVFASTGALLMSNKIMRNRYAALFMLYSFTDQMLDRWKTASQENMTAKAYQKVKESIAKSDTSVPEEMKDGEGMIYLDRLNGKWFRARDVESVRKIINDLNAVAYREDFVPVNHFYHALGIEGTEDGDNIGWFAEDGPIDIDWVPIIRDDVAYMSLIFNVKPRDYGTMWD